MSRPRLFGTDGIRAPFGVPPLDRATVTALARALAATLEAPPADTARPPQPAAPLVVLGGDTRESREEICQWLAAGLAAGGARPRYAGIIPTPGIARLTRDLSAAAGISVSASHNPHPDNGIKLIDGDGFKWSEAAELALEERLGRSPAPDVEVDFGLSALAADPALGPRYLDELAATLPAGRPLAGLRLVIDAGNGAASPFAGPLFTRLGADLEVLSASPDGRNVNEDCGSTAPEAMAARVRARGADSAGLGAAFDGDADRAILADERGEVRDGDAMLYLWATHLHRQGRLDPPAIVATSMSNLGLERALAREGIALVRCDVGDRAVVDAMRRQGIVLGGEQSGHLVHLGLSTTGDGLLTALQMAGIVAATGRPLSDLLAGFRRYPQVLLNVRVREKPELLALPSVAAAVRDVESRLGADGRLVLRYSGTEPLARVMIEGPEQGVVDHLAGGIAEAIAAEIGVAPG
ncbi:MAG TPA: phosphoglucosamine mutase [Thermoanaerobaculia bacterium]